MRRPIHCQDTKETALTYKEYLTTEHWKRLRERYNHKGKACGICRCQGLMNLHHKNYKRLGREQKGDVVLLCSECHTFVHYCIEKKKSEITKTTKMLKDVVMGRMRIEKLKPPRVKKRQFSLRKILSSGLPATLHHSIHASVNNWFKEGLSVDEVIGKYETRKKRDIAMLELYNKNKPLAKVLIRKLGKYYVPHR